MSTSQIRDGKNDICCFSRKVHVCQWKQTLKRCNQTSSHCREVPFPPWRHPRKSMIASRQILGRFPEIKAFKLIVSTSALISLSHSLLTFWAGFAVTTWGLQEEAGSCLSQVWDTWNCSSRYAKWHGQSLLVMVRAEPAPRLEMSSHVSSATLCLTHCQELTAGG